MSCGCNGHTSTPGAELDPTDWTINIFDDSVAPVTYYTPTVTGTHKVYSEDFESVETDVNAERVRHSTGTINIPNGIGVVIDADHYNALINGLNDVYASGLGTVPVGTVINASDINTLISKLATSGSQCICNTNYCTCNCNQCTCNCNYTCTCNCNY